VRLLEREKAGEEGVEKAPTFPTPHVRFITIENVFNKSSVGRFFLSLIKRTPGAGGGTGLGGIGKADDAGYENLWLLRFCHFQGIVKML